MVFTVMAALAQMELDIKRERVGELVSKRRALVWMWVRAGRCTDRQIESAAHLIEKGQLAMQGARDLGMSRATLYRRIRELTSGAV